MTGKKGKVLVVDDAIFMRRMLTDILTEAGYEVVADGYLGALYKSMNMQAKSKAILEKLLESEKNEPDLKAPFAIAHIYAALNKPDEMFDFLNKSVERKDHSVIYILGNSPFKKYRSDPRFTRLIKKIGLWK